MKLEKEVLELCQEKSPGFPIEKYMDELESIINIDSGSMNIEGNLKIAKFFKERFGSLNMHTKILEIGPNKRPFLVADTLSSGTEEEMLLHKPYFLLCGHMDTVFPHGTVAKRPLTIEGNTAYGPGTVDMKAGDLNILYLVEFFKENYPEIPIRVILDCDEEISGIDSTPYLREYAKDCKVAFIFEGMRKHGYFVNERKGMLNYTVKVYGKASHAGTAPKQGISAIVELAHVIETMDSAKNLLMGTSVNIGTISGGQATNVVAPFATCDLEVRFTSKKEAERIRKVILKLETKPYLSGAKVEFVENFTENPLNINERTKVLMEDLGTLVPGYLKAGGLSDANKLSQLDIAIIDGCGPGGGQPHSEREFLSIDTVPERFETMKRIIQKAWEKRIHFD